MDTSKLPRYIYLDQNKWIDLHGALRGRPDRAEYRNVLSKLDSARRDGRAIIPFSAAHLLEAPVARQDRRAGLGELVAYMSQGHSIAPVDALSRVEVDRAVAHLFGELYLGEPPRPFGMGVNFAFGIPEKEFAEKLGSTPGMAQLVNAIMSSPRGVKLLYEQSGDLGLNKLLREHRQGWSVKWNRRREALRASSREVRQRHYAAILTFHLQESLRTSAERVGKSLQDVFGMGSARLMGLIADIPTADVETKLFTLRDQQWDRKAQPGDLVDIDFLAAAVVYCDVVVTERFWVKLVRHSGLDKKYRTEMLANLAELELHL